MIKSCYRRPVIIFDSGVGGISIYRSVKKILFNEHIVYCADTEVFPYGKLSQQEITNRVKQCFLALSRRFDPAVMVLACNTASTVVLSELRQLISIPIVGVVPAIKVAGEHSKKRVIGLLSTLATAQSTYIDKLIVSFAQDCQVIRLGSDQLVGLAEKYFRTGHVDNQCLREIIDPFVTRKDWPDYVVLGCTHFPLLKSQLQCISEVPIEWIDSGDAVARRIKELLGKQNIGMEGVGNKDSFLYTGKVNSDFEEFESAVRLSGFSNFNYFQMHVVGSI